VLNAQLVATRSRPVAGKIIHETLAALCADHGATWHEGNKISRAVRSQGPQLRNTDIRIKPGCKDQSKGLWNRSWMGFTRQFVARPEMGCRSACYHYSVPGLSTDEHETGQGYVLAIRPV
jgi:hypothetical protein